jgi:hypothetical protein
VQERAGDPEEKEEDWQCGEATAFDPMIATLEKIQNSASV